MTIYAKLKNGSPIFLAGPHNIINPTEEQIAKYAKEYGYKPVINTPKPGLYYTETWIETAEAITNFWIPFELEQAKNNALDKVQIALTTSLSKRTIISCTGFENGIVYDADALTNAAGMSVGDMYIDATNNVTVLTEETLDAIRVALKQHRLSLYTNATSKRTLIAEAKIVDEVEAAL